MVELRIYSEGEGERGFVLYVLAPHLEKFDVHVKGCFFGHAGVNPSGGIRNWEGKRRGARQELLLALRDASSNYDLFVSTMVDFYGLPTSWPNRAEAAKLPPAKRSAHVENGMKEDMREALGDDPRVERFIPYVCLHELEALILAHPEALLVEFPDARRQVEALKTSLGAAPPEEINDGEHSAPSKRIIQYIPEYEARKRIAATNALRAMELDIIRRSCPHFDSWLSRLEALGRSVH